MSKSEGKKKWIKKVSRSERFGQLVAALNAWEIPEGTVGTVHDVARASLNEVKALTEYEDGKVSRLLTVIAFLSAVVAAAFTRFSSDYRWPRVDSYCMTLAWWLPFGTYAAFFLYLSMVTVATLLLLIAIRPRFNLPKSWKGDGRSGLPSSMLFYKGILDVTALQWGETFQQKATADGSELKALYAKSYIGEAYLVAEKVADKLRAAARGVTLLLWSLGVLLLFFFFLVLTTQVVHPVKP